MANEIRATIRLVHEKNPKISFSPGSISLDQVGTGVFARSVYVGPDETTIAFDGINTPGTVIVWNIDPENPVRVGVDNGGLQPIGLLQPGSKLPLIVPWFPGAVLSLQSEVPGSGTAGTGTFDEYAEVQIIVYEA